MARPLVTIPIAAYKSRPEHLAAAVESALTQTWQEVEVVVSDDSPEPSLKAVVEQFGDPRVRYQHNVPRLGVARNHWLAFRHARGEFIAVLNHDDLFAKTFLEELVPPLQADPDLVLAFCDHWVVDAEGQPDVEKTDRMTAHWGRDRLAKGKIAPFFDLLVAQSIPMVMGTVFRRSALPKELPDDAGPAYDLWLTYLLCREGRGAYFVPDRLSSWRAHAGNLTSQAGFDWSSGSAACWLAASRDPNLASVRPAVRQKCAIASNASAVSAWRSGRRWDAFRYGRQSVLAKPTAKGLLACLLPIVPRRLLKIVKPQ